MYGSNVVSIMADTYVDKPTPWRDRERLFEKYHNEGKTAPEIADEWDVHRQTIFTWLDKHEIETRSPSECQKGIQLGENHPRWREGVFNDRGWLRKEYVTKRRSMADIADQFEVDRTVICDRLDRFGIKRRDPAPPTNTHLVADNHPMYNGGKATAKCEWCDEKFEHWPCKDRRFCSEKCRYDWYSGERHPEWKGGETFNYGRGWNETKREQVRDRDSRECQGCGMSEPEHVDAHGGKLHVHHITPARQFDDPKERNALDNLITVCISCHRSAEVMAPLFPFQH